MKEDNALIAENKALKNALNAFIKWDKDYPAGSNPMRGLYAFNALISNAEAILRQFNTEKGDQP